MQQVLIIVLIMCFRGTRGPRNHIITRRLLQKKSNRDNDVVKASLSRDITPTRSLNLVYEQLSPHSNHHYPKPDAS